MSGSRAAEVGGWTIALAACVVVPVLVLSAGWLSWSSDTAAWVGFWLSCSLVVVGVACAVPRRTRPLGLGMVAGGVLSQLVVICFLVIVVAPNLA